MLGAPYLFAFAIVVAAVGAIYDWRTGHIPNWVTLGPLVAAPFDDADWTTSWRKTRVSAVQWKQLREELANEAHRWLEVLQKPREVGQTDLNGVVASVAHSGRLWSGEEPGFASVATAISTPWSARRRPSFGT